MSSAECGMRSAAPKFRGEPRLAAAGSGLSSSLKPQVSSLFFSESRTQKAESGLRYSAFRIPHSALVWASSLFFLLLLAALPAAAQTIYTENWSSLNSNWTVLAGTPVANSGYLRNADSDVATPTRLLYSGTLQIQDYSVQSVLLCQGLPSPPEYLPAFYHYLRAAGDNRYTVTASWTGAPSSTTMTVSVYRLGSAGTAFLGSTTTTCGTLKSVIQGSTITVSMNGTTLLSLSDSSYASGGLGVGTAGAPNTEANSGIGQTVLAYADNQPPSVPTGLNAVPYSTRVNLSWNASTDNVGVAGYKIFRTLGAETIYVGSSTINSFTDETVFPNTTYTYKVSAYDAALNESAQSAPLTTTTPPASFSGPDPGGPVEYASSWGAGPERITLLTSALALRVPLFKLQHRTRGPGFGMIASWNSQFWRWDAAGTRMLAIDTGYGLGFNFTLGGMYPIFSGNELVRFEFEDAAGAIHKLWPTGTPNQYKSQDSTYLLWDNANRTLTFTDGTVWTFDCVAQGQEPGAGTRHPTRLRDTNGNLIDITYKPALGLTQTNTSARIETIKDSLTTYTWTYATINGAPHVTTVYHFKNPGEQFNDAIFTYETRTDIVSPFTTPLTGQPLTRVLLKEITFTGAMGPFKFEYNTSAEITKFTVPHKGYFRYNYVTASLSNNGWQIREVNYRYTSANGSLPEDTYTFSHPSGDASLPQHTETTLLDPANNKKVWDFIQGSSLGWDNGLEYKHEVLQGPGYTLKQRSETSWTQDNPASQSLTNPRVASVASTLEDGVTKSKTERDVDANGNVTQVREYAFGNLTTPYRTTSTTYLNNSNYTSLNILNRPAEVRVCAGVAGCATPVSTTTITYDTSACSDVPNITQHDPTYGTSFLYRGLPRSVNANGVTTSSGCDIGGNPGSTGDSLGHILATAGYNPEASQVTSVTSGGSNTSINYNNDTTPSNVTGSNTDTVSFTYASYRPTNIQRPDGSAITYSYSDATNPVTQTQAGAAGVTTTTFDGFGRVIKTARQENASSWIYTETQYSACSCSSTGKAVKTSRPYRAGQTPVWTETQYDALGRPTKVILPDSSETNYTYSVENNANWTGTLTLITDPAGKQKRYLHDAFGRLLRVDEPDAAGALTETARYSYDVMGRLTTVQMGRNVNQPLNSSFESGVGSWILYGGAGTPTQTSAQAKVGTYSLQQPAGSGNGGVYQDVSGLVPGQTYRVRAWVRGSAGNTLTVQLWLHDTVGGFHLYATLANPSSTTWSLLEVDFMASATAAVRIHLNQVSGAGTAYWDYVTVSGLSSGAGTVKQTRTFNYNTAGQLTSATNPENGTVSYTYYADGLPQSKTDAKNQTLWFFYDNNHRLLRIESPQGTVKTSFTYDTNATVPATYAQGRMTSAANDGYTWHLSYDIMGRVNKQTLQTAANTYIQAQYGYNTAGQVWNLYYPGTIASAPGSVLPGRQYQYTYDATFVRALSLAWYDTATANWVTRAQNAQYSAASQLTSWQEESSTPGLWNTLTRSYSDQRGWVTNIRALNPNNTALLDLTYGYLANGRVSSVTDVVNPGQSVSAYEYDLLNRLTKATTPNWALQWTYDEFGNRLTQSKVPGSPGTPPESTLSYGESTNRITTAGYTYDLNGNLTAAPAVNGQPALSNAYDVFDRAITINGTTAKYDAFGRRIERVVSGTTRVFFYDMGGRLLSEYLGTSAGTQPSKRIEYFAGQRVGDYTDRTGNVRYTVYAGGGAWRHYYPFGEEITGTSSDTYKFADLYRDADTGLDYANARYYASSHGRFLTPDPYKAAGGPYVPQNWNRYAYVHNDPINYFDPWGTNEADPNPPDPPMGGWQPLGYWGYYTSNGEENYGQTIGGGPFPPGMPSSPGSTGGGAGGAQGAARDVIRITNFSTTSAHATGVQNSLRWIRAALDEDETCGTWLGNYRSTIAVLLGEAEGSDKVYAGVGNFSDNSVNAVAGIGGTDLAPDTALLTVNLTGAFFSSAGNTDSGRIRGGGDEAKAFILSHELAHLTNAAGFLDNDRGDASRQRTNNDLIHKHCQRTLDRAAGRLQ